MINQHFNYFLMIFVILIFDFVLNLYLVILLLLNLYARVSYHLLPIIVILFVIGKVLGK
jgi:hypothetical protein